MPVDAEYARAYWWSVPGKAPHSLVTHLGNNTHLRALLRDCQNRIRVASEPVPAVVGINHDCTR